MQSAFMTAASRPEPSGKPPAGPSMVWLPAGMLADCLHAHGARLFNGATQPPCVSSQTRWAQHDVQLLAGQRSATAAAHAARTGAPQPLEPGAHQLPALTAHQACCAPQAGRHPDAPGGL